MIPFWLLAIFVFGVNFTVWGTAGVFRILDQRLSKLRRSRRSWPTWDPDAHSVVVERVAVLMAAHNEELVIADSLAAITELVPAANVHVVSDGSTDRTVEAARECGVNVTRTPFNVGKAGALQEGIRHFHLDTRFDAVLLLDADTRLYPEYFRAALPLFDDPEVVAVAGCAVTDWPSARKTPLGLLLTAHRSRIYALMQRLLKFGQTWRRANATFIVPGFASLYRARVLPDIDINPPGLVIEDFNMTFEVYRGKLGKVGFTTLARARTQDPDNLHDYLRQTKRWALGFWQTVRRFRPRADLFTAMLSVYLVELVLASVMILLLPLLVLVLGVPDVFPVMTHWAGIGPAHLVLSQHLALRNIGLGVVLPDVLLTVAVALTERRAFYLLFAPLYLPLRIVDAAVGLYSLPRAFRERSTGQWKSPQRRGAAGEVPDTKEQPALTLLTPTGTEAVHPRNGAPRGETP